MKKNMLIICLLAFLAQGAYPAQPVKIIFDTDMGPDYDDVGAITVLHALAGNNECKILAACACDRYPTIAPTIEVFNRYFKKPDIPIGVAQGNAPDFSSKNHWNDSIVVKFLGALKTNDDFPSAVDIYRKVLASQANQSVTIVSVGFMSNLADLLKSGADQYSPFSGMELVKKKVKNLVAMAGIFPQGSEFNIDRDAKASVYALNNWPTTILFSGFEIGDKILTGRKVADEGPSNSPVRWAYTYNLDTYEGKKMEKRKSWDQTAVLCAVRNPETYFYVVGPGKIIIHENGSDEWMPDKNGQHYFLAHKYPYQKIADIIDELMMYKPMEK